LGLASTKFGEKRIVGLCRIKAAIEENADGRNRRRGIVDRDDRERNQDRHEGRRRYSSSFFYMKKKIAVKEKEGMSGWSQVNEIGTCR
jgi:hypothetical protein